MVLYVASSPLTDESRFPRSLSAICSLVNVLGLAAFLKDELRSVPTVGYCASLGDIRVACPAGKVGIHDLVHPSKDTRQAE